jgi:hypothetical protein
MSNPFAGHGSSQNKKKNDKQQKYTAANVHVGLLWLPALSEV